MVREEASAVLRLKFSPGQIQRLRELCSDRELIEIISSREFESIDEREREFNRLIKDLTRRNIESLKNYLNAKRKPAIRVVEEKLRSAALAMGFSEVVTPIIITKDFIKKMGIREESNLWKQIFWLGNKLCLRPMLAPGLYAVMSKLKTLQKPLRLFEVGPCFRRDTGGPLHLEEFTMFNLVELAPNKDPEERLLEVIEVLMEAVKVKDYEVTRESSEVYGETLDVKVGGVEVASAAIGPKPMDVHWGIDEPWVGVGFGVERLAMVIKGCYSIARVSRSLTYLDGARIDVLQQG